MIDFQVRHGVFLPASAFSADSPSAIACINICAHVMNPVAHVKVRWIMETLIYAACTVGWGSATLSQLVFPREGSPNFPREKPQLRNSVFLLFFFCVCVGVCVVCLFVFFANLSNINLQLSSTPPPHTPTPQQPSNKINKSCIPLMLSPRIDCHTNL